MLDFLVLHLSEKCGDMDLFAKHPESESLLFFGQVEMSRGGRNGFGGRGGGRGRSRFVFTIFVRSENIFVSSFSRDLCWCRSRSPRRGRSPARRRSRSRSGGRRRSPSYRFELLRFDRHHPSYKDGNPFCRCELLRFCEDNPLPTGA